jgi:hypothetical protein
MQTFLPYDSLIDSVKCLDDRRLGKQRVEAAQIINILEGKQLSNAWKNHPAVLMWDGYIEALKYYYNCCLQEWSHRGFKNIKLQLFNNYENFHSIPSFPPWLGNPKFHASHRSNLLRKNHQYYKKFNWKEPNNLPYLWPTKQLALKNFN